MQNSQIKVSLFKDHLSVEGSKNKISIPYSYLQSDSDKTLGILNSFSLVLMNQNIDWYFKKLDFSQSIIWFPKVCNKFNTMRGTIGCYSPEVGIIFHVGQSNSPISDRKGETYIFNTSSNIDTSISKVDYPSLLQETVIVLRENFEGTDPIIFSATGEPLLNAIYLILMRLTFPYRNLVCNNLFQESKDQEIKKENRGYKILSRALKMGVDAKQQLSLNQSKIDLSTDDLKQLLHPRFMLELSDYLNKQTKILSPFLT